MSIIFKQIKYSGILDGITSYMLLTPLKSTTRQIELNLCKWRHKLKDFSTETYPSQNVNARIIKSQAHRNR